MPPKVLAKQQGDRSGGAPGVLAVPASARVAPQKNQNVARLKLEIRRLPPGLTLQEFEQALGQEWRLGGGKVDWREFRTGKVRKSNKLPEMGRCYVHVTNENLVKEFEKVFLGTKFEDHAGTYKDREVRAMGWLPQLGFAPNQRVPAVGRVRRDQRQGTIDQDPEFMAFLEGETQVIARPANVDHLNERDKEVAEIKSTPLIDDLREKKAKAEQKKKEGKESGGKGKHARGESKDTNTTDKDAKVSQSHKGEQSTKAGSKGASKQNASKQAQSVQAQQATKGTQSPARSKKQPAANQSPKPQNATPGSPSPVSSRPSSSQGPAPQRGQQGRQRGNADGIKKMLQKDLGIRPKGGQGQQPRNNQSASNTSTTNTGQSNTASTAAEAPSAPTAPKNNNTQATSSQTAKEAGKTAKPSTKAYLKHANPSQGITEILLQTTLSQLFGPVTNVTIDPRKGTAIAVFKETSDLKKAVETKKVQVASGAVEVVEWKDRAGGGSGGGGSGGSGSGNGSSGNWGSSRGGLRGGRGGKGPRGGGGSGGGNNANATNSPGGT